MHFEIERLNNWHKTNFRLLKLIRDCCMEKMTTNLLFGLAYLVVFHFSFFKSIPSQ